MRLSAAALATVVLLLAASSPAGSQPASMPKLDKRVPLDQQRGSDDAMTDIDPMILEQCKAEATNKRLIGKEREQFVLSCVEPED